MKHLYEYRYFKIDRNKGNVKDKNEPFFWGPKTKYWFNKYEDERNKKDEENKKIEEKTREYYLNLLNEYENDLKQIIELFKKNKIDKYQTEDDGYTATSEKFKLGKYFIEYFQDGYNHYENLYIHFHNDSNKDITLKSEKSTENEWFTPLSDEIISLIKKYVNNKYQEKRFFD